MEMLIFVKDTHHGVLASYNHYGALNKGKEGHFGCSKAWDEATYKKGA